jgi:hypothetical protein
METTNIIKSDEFGYLFPLLLHNIFLSEEHLRVWSGRQHRMGTILLWRVAGATIAVGQAAVVRERAVKGHT